jgi:hypothetical protein
MKLDILQSTKKLRKMLTSVSGALVKEPQYSKNTLKLVQSMLVKYKKSYFQCKSYLFCLMHKKQKAYQRRESDIQKKAARTETKQQQQTEGQQYKASIKNTATHLNN